MFNNNGASNTDCANNICNNISDNNTAVFSCTQIFADTPDDEAEMLKSFIDVLSEGTVLVTYNGTTFDLPFVKARCAHHGIDCSVLDKCCHIDIYTHVKKLNSLLGLDSLKQKSIETFLGYDREDIYGGGELIKVYRDYIIKFKLSDTDEAGKLRGIMLLHNREDVMYLAKICQVLLYNEVINIANSDVLKLDDMRFVTCSTYDNMTDGYDFILNGASNLNNNLLSESGVVKGKQEVECLDTVISGIEYEFKSAIQFPQVFSKDANGIKLEISHNTVTFKIPVTEGELCHFYSDYRNYFYLPAEDRAIHKSVAAYVDAANREKATKENCYSKRKGYFIPNINETPYPCFKRHYNDKESYIQFDEKLCSEPKFIANYVSSIMQKHMTV
jgi:hypothetical protein